MAVVVEKKGISKNTLHVGYSLFRTEQPPSVEYHYMTSPLTSLALLWRQNQQILPQYYGPHLAMEEIKNVYLNACFLSGILFLLLCTDHDEWIFCSRPDPDMSLLQVLLGQQGLLKAREQVVVLGRVSQSICCLLVDLGKTLFPQLHHPAGKKKVYCLNDA